MSRNAYIVPMRYGEGLLEEIRRRTDLVQLVGRRVKLVRKGRVMWGCCPFHAEKSPSFKVENERRTYKCFGCGAGGDGFKWLMETEGLSFPESVQKLAGEAGVELPAWSPDDEAREVKKKSLYEIVELAAVFYESQLREASGREARDYLKTRGLDGAAAKQFRLGYAPANGHALIEFLTSKNITQDDMIAAGLARPAEENRPMRDFFYDRLMFPIADARGRTIAFGGRGLTADAKPKYINSGENTLFSKGFNLYNFHVARAAAIKAGTVILAEGYMDVIALVRAGFAHAVAPLGTALTDDQLQLLWRTTPEPVLAFDGDAAGLKAAHRAAHLALPHLKAGFSLRFAFLPAGEDPDTLIAKSGSAGMGKILEAALPLSEVLWRTETEGHDFSTPERRAGLEQRLREIVSQITDGKIADYYRRDFEQKVFDSFKARKAPAAAGRSRPYVDRNRPAYATAGVSSALKSSNLTIKASAQSSHQPPVDDQGRIAIRRPLPPVPPPKRAAEGIGAIGAKRQSSDAARKLKEAELATLLLSHPALALSQGELVASLPFLDPSLDRLRHELLNLAASGSSLEKPPVLNHLLHQGMAELLTRLGTRENDQDEAMHETEARFLRAAGDLREMAEWEPERARAFQRLGSEASEESWQEARRLLRSSGE
ncbi:MAG TPA: DNA primase [Rhizomicrobium sp.]|nr:DNA primase [Rhizomicrobium sp.]